MGSLIPQTHGGALRNGGTNKGGGRLSSRIKRAAMKGLHEAMPEIRAIAKGEGKPQRVTEDSR